MVMRRTLPASKVLYFSLLTLQCFLLLTGCSHGGNVTVSPDFKLNPEQEVIYVVPFVSTLVPADFAETVFNEFVDRLNENGAKTGVKWFFIVKEEQKDIDPSWLARQVYLSGEIWSYIENSGCCSTEMRVKARIAWHDPGRKDPTLEILLPLDTFFEHDRSTIGIERERLAKKLARELSDQVITAITKRK